MRPGTTKAFTMTANAWVRVATLYDPLSTPDIKDGDAVAQGLYFNITTQAAQIAFSDTVPVEEGHPFAVSDAFYGEHRDFVRRMWIKNNVAGSNAVIIVTPVYAL